MRKRKIFILSALLIILLFSLISCSNQDNMESKNNMESKTSSIFLRGEAKNCRITAEKAEVKAGTNTRYRTITTLNKGDEVKVLGEVSDWYIVQLKDRRIGCVNKNQATPIVKDGQEPQRPLPTQYPEREEAPPADVEPAQDLSSQEQKMINLVNSERKKNGLTPYKVDSELTRVARIKAQDMVKNNYFSHYSPTYGSPFEMMDHFGIEYVRAGENIAGNQSVEGAHRSLMNSSGHRQNILNPNFTHIGIGIKESDRYGYIYVQMFISKPE